MSEYDADPEYEAELPSHGHRCGRCDVDVPAEAEECPECGASL